MSELTMPRSIWLALSEAERIIGEFGYPEVGCADFIDGVDEHRPAIMDGIVKTVHIKIWCFHSDRPRNRHKFLFDIKLWQHDGEWDIIQTLYIAYAQFVDRRLLPAIRREAHQRSRDSGEFAAEIGLIAFAGENRQVERLKADCRYHDGQRKFFTILSSNLEE